MTTPLTKVSKLQSKFINVTKHLANQLLYRNSHKSSEIKSNVGLTIDTDRVLVSKDTLNRQCFVIKDNKCILKKSHDYY